MEDSIGYEMFLNDCATKDEFEFLLKCMDEAMQDKKKYEEAVNTWAVFYKNGTSESKEAYEYLRKISPQPFITQLIESDHTGPFLEIGSFRIGNRRKRNLEGIEQIKQYADKMAEYKETHSKKKTNINKPKQLPS